MMGQPSAYGGQSLPPTFNEPYGQQGGSFGRGANAMPASLNHHQHHLPQHLQYQQAYQPQQQQQQSFGTPHSFGAALGADVGRRGFKEIRNATAANIAAALEEFRQETGIEDPVVQFMDRQTAREREQSLETEFPERSTRRANKSQEVDITSGPVTDASRRNAREVQGSSGSMRPESFPILEFHNLSSQTVRELREGLRSNRRLDIVSTPVMNSADPTAPMLPPQRQAGRGALPGARDAQGNSAGVGLLGNHRVEKPDAARGRGQQQRQGASRGGSSVHTGHARGGMDDEDEDAPDAEGARRMSDDPGAYEGFRKPWRPQNTKPAAQGQTVSESENTPARTEGTNARQPQPQNRPARPEEPFRHASIWAPGTINREPPENPEKRQRRDETE